MRRIPRAGIAVSRLGSHCVCVGTSAGRRAASKHTGDGMDLVSRSKFGCSVNLASDLRSVSGRTAERQHCQHSTVSAVSMPMSEEAGAHFVHDAEEEMGDRACRLGPAWSVRRKDSASGPKARALAPEEGRMISGKNPDAGSQAQGARTVDRVCENGAALALR